MGSEGPEAGPWLPIFMRFDPVAGISPHPRRQTTMKLLFLGLGHRRYPIQHILVVGRLLELYFTRESAKRFPSNRPSNGPSGPKKAFSDEIFFGGDKQLLFSLFNFVCWVKVVYLQKSHFGGSSTLSVLYPN